MSAPRRKRSDRSETADALRGESISHAGRANRSLKQRDEDENLMGVGSTRKRQASRRTIETLERRVVYASARDGKNRQRGGRANTRAVVGGGEPRRGESSREDRRLECLKWGSGVSTDSPLAQSPEGGCSQQRQEGHDQPRGVRRR